MAPRSNKSSRRSSDSSSSDSSSSDSSSSDHDLDHVSNSRQRSNIDVERKSSNRRPMKEPKTGRNKKDPQDRENSSEEDSDDLLETTDLVGKDFYYDDESNTSGEGSNRGSDEDEDDDSGDDDRADLSLAERLKRNDEKGVSLHAVRSRKSRALEVANERLAKFRKQKQQQTTNQLLHTTEAEDQARKSKKKKKKGPTEVSSKRVDFFKRGARQLNESGIGVAIGAHRYKPLDPRTSSMSGHLNVEQFEKNFAFVQELRDKEIVELKKRIAARKATGKKGHRMRQRLHVQAGVSETTLEEDQMKLQTLVQEKGDMERQKIDRAAKQTVKKKIRDGVAQGKHGVYYLKRREQKRLELEAKFEEIRKRGGDEAVEKVLAKRRRKNKSRDSGLFLGK